MQSGKENRCEYIHNCISMCKRYDRGAYSRYCEAFSGKTKIKPSLEGLVRAHQVARGNVSIRKESMSKEMDIEITFSFSRVQYLVLRNGSRDQKDDFWRTGGG